MERTVKRLLENECKKHIKRHHKRLVINRSFQQKFTKRTGQKAKKKGNLIPGHWHLDNLFNPFYVLSNIDCLTYTIAKKIREQTYKPKPCLINTIPKMGGGDRKISVFTIPDAVVAKYLYNVLLKRNFAIFSSYAFAYRTDRNAHNAIEYLFQVVKGVPRTYVLEYDFSKYFDTISHEYLVELLENKLKITQRELYLVKQFLKYDKAEGTDKYKHKQFVQNSIGIPQGSTISLFLANIACFELDKKIETEGVAFARFSDDIVIICDTYDKAHKCANHMIAHGTFSGTKINFRKSNGISLLTEDKQAEIRAKEHFDFLGHKISNTQISLREGTIKRIKSRISNTINRHLIHYPGKYGFSKKRYSVKDETDWDLVTCINEIRRYIYGKVSEKQLSKCLNDKNEPLVFTRCMMSFYPLVTDDYIFRSLDGWLCGTLDKALNVRAKIIRKHVSSYKRPTKEKLISGDWYKSKLQVETKLPSFYKSWIYTRKLVKIYGIQKFPNPEYY